MLNRKQRRAAGERGQKEQEGPTVPEIIPQILLRCAGESCTEFLSLPYEWMSDMDFVEGYLVESGWTLIRVEETDLTGKAEVAEEPPGRVTFEAEEAEEPYDFPFVDVPFCSTCTEKHEAEEIVGEAP